MTIAVLISTVDHMIITGIYDFPSSQRFCSPFVFSTWSYNSSWYLRLPSSTNHSVLPLSQLVEGTQIFIPQGPRPLAALPGLVCVFSTDLNHKAW